MVSARFLWIRMSWKWLDEVPLAVSQLGRALSCQMIVSNGWNLQLGDIRGASLEADSLDGNQGPLYSSLPPGGISGVSDDAMIDT